MFFFGFWIKRPTVSTASARSFSIQVHQNRGKQCLNIFLSFNDADNLSASTAASSSLTTLHSSSSNLADPWNPNLFILHLSDWKMVVGEENMISRDNSWRRLLWAVPPGGSMTSGNRFLSPDISLRRSVSDTPRHHKHSRSKHIRSQPVPYSGNNNGDGPGYHH